MKTARILTIVLLTLTVALATHAAPVWFFGEDVAPQGNPNCDIPRPDIPNSRGAASNFLSRLAGVFTETFESYAPGPAPTTLNFGADTATISFSGGPSGTIEDFPTGTFCGAYPISGNRFLDVLATFTIDFSYPQAAFGFYATDLELLGLNVTLVYTNGSRSTNVVPVTIPQGSGGALFFGVIDTEIPFVRIEFTGAGTGDGFGFDDMTIGRVEQVRPELQIWPAVELGWFGHTGRVYQLQYSTNIPTTQWFDLGSPVVGTGASNFLFDSTRYNMKRFYRLVSTNQ